MANDIDLYYATSVLMAVNRVVDYLLAAVNQMESVGMTNMKKACCALRFPDQGLFAKVLSVTSLLLFLFGFGVHAVAADTDINKIRWLINDIPPYLSLEATASEGLPQGEGPAIEFVRYVVEQMPDTRHEFEKSSFPRFTGLMKRGTFLCTPLLLKVSEREAYIEFSLPIIMTLPLYVVVSEEKLELLAPYQDKNGKVDLEQLLMSADLTTSVTKERAYPKIISQMFEKSANQKNMVLSSADFSIPFKQLLAGRIDYVVAYPFELQWHLSHSERAKGKVIRYVPIAGMPEYMLGHVGCTKGEEGRKAIQHINQIIKAAGPRPHWHQLQSEYLDPDSIQELETLLLRYQPFGPF